MVRSEAEWNDIFIERQKFIVAWCNANGHPNPCENLIDMLLRFWAGVSARSTEEQAK